MMKLKFKMVLLKLYIISIHMFYTQNNYINFILYKNLNAYRFVTATQRSYALALQKIIESLCKFDHIPCLTYV